MYNDYYGMTRNTFDKQQCTEEDFFPCRDIKETSARLKYLIRTRGIGVITARPGLGKSYGVRCFAKGLNENLFHVEYMCLSTINVMDFYKGLCRILGISEKGGKTSMFRSLQEQKIGRASCRERV